MKVPKALVELIDPHEVRKFLQNLSRHRDLSIVLLMLFSGLRSKEVLSLRVTDVDLSKLELRAWGKGSKERILPLPLSVAQTIEKYLALERPSPSHTYQLFVVLQGARRGHPMSRSGLRSLFRYRRLVSNIKKANPHRWRHAFGSAMARAGVQLPILQKMMGHVDPSTTLQYINLYMEDVAKEYKKAIAEIQRLYEEN